MNLQSLGFPLDISCQKLCSLDVLAIPARWLAGWPSSAESKSTTRTLAILEQTLMQALVFREQDVTPE